MKRNGACRGGSLIGAGVLGLLLCGTGQGQIFVANSITGTIGKYSPSGEVLNASLITGLLVPEGITVDGNGFLYVANEQNGTIGKYTTDGQVVHRALISGLSSPWAIAFDGSGNLYVANYGGSIGKYTASGDPINPALVAGLASPIGIALDSKGQLFVSNYGRFSEGWVGSIGKYSTSGQVLNASLIRGLKWNWGIVINESEDLSVAFNSSGGKIAQYTASGEALNAFETGLAAPTAIALNAEGHLLVADDWTGQVGEYTTDGEKVNPALIAGPRGCRGVAVCVPPSVFVRGGDRTVETGSTVRFAARCRGTRPFTCMWLLNGTNTVALGSEPVLELTDVQPGQSGAYSLVVSNAFGTVSNALGMLGVVAPVPRRWVPALAVSGQAMSRVNLDRAAALGASPEWVTFDAVVLTNEPLFYFDLEPQLPAQRFYRVSQPNVQTGARLALDFVPAITLTGASGSSVRIDCINERGPIDAWVTLATVTLESASQLYFDSSSIRQPPRLYRIVPLR